MANVSSHLGSPPLPLEIWLAILNHVGNLADLANLARINQNFWSLAIPILYNQAASSSPLDKHRALFWGVVHELPRTLESALAAGINVDLPWHSFHRATKFEEFSEFLSSYALDQLPGDDDEEDEDEGEMSETAEYSEYHDWRWYAIHIAVWKGNIPIIELLLKHNPRLNVGCLGLCGCEIQPQLLGPRTADSCSLQTPLWTPLHVAICSGQIRVAEMLISRGASEDMEELQVGSDLVPTGLTCLHVACMSGQTHLVEWLLNSHYRQKIDMLDSASQSALVYAYLYRRWDSFQVMLNHGADINIIVTDRLPSFTSRDVEDGDEDEESMSQTMLYSAIQDRRFEDACRLIGFGASLQTTGGPDNLPLINLLCESPWDLRPGFAWQVQECDPYAQDLHGSIVLDLLLESGLQFNKSFMGIPALGHAAESANLLAVKRLLHAGADANGDEDTDAPPLLKALENPYQRSILDIVSLLLDSGAVVGYDTAVLEPALWSLYIHNEDESELKLITELLLQHGASPARGTSTGDAKFTTPLEKLLTDGNVTAFETLLMRCGQGYLGEDDIVGFWRSVSSRSEIKLIDYILDMDGCEAILQKYDVIYLPIPRLSVQIPTPFNLILKLLQLEKNSKKGSGYLGSIVNRAIVQNASPLLVNNLLDAGASHHHMYKFRTPLMEVLSNHGRSMDLRKEYIRVLLGAGDCMYRELGMYYSPHLGPHEGPNTILGFALNEMEKDARVMSLIKLMLELQPLRAEASIQTYIYLRRACIIGRMRVLMAVIGSSDVAVCAIRSNANKLIHEMLDTMSAQQKTFGDMNDAIDCLEFVIIQGGDCLNSSAPDVSNDTRTAKEKLLTLLWSNVSCISVVAGIRWCMRNRIKLSAENLTPEFIQPRRLSLCGVIVDDSTSLAEIGQLLQK